MYGVGRISQVGTSTEYFLGDALGSVRQLTNEAAEITLTKAYEPYGEETWSHGAGQSTYGFAAEWTDANGLIHLRARYYAPDQGRFFQQDPWEGDPYSPSSLNPYEYVKNNPVLYTDPSGNCIFAGVDTMICLALAGATAGFAAGIIGGALFGAATYYAALAGECGCEMQEQAIAAGSYGYYVGMLSLTGGIFGGIAGAIAGAAPIGALIVGAGGILISGYDAYKTYNIIMNETGLTKCTLLRGLMDIAGILGGVTAIKTSVQAFKKSGSWLKWKGTNESPTVKPGAKCSFAGDTEVTTSEGDKPIWEIKIGDHVLAWNSETGEISFERVTDTHRHVDPVIVHLIIDGEEITTTPEHPFYVEGKGWVTAGDLQVGDKVRNAKEETGKVEKVTTEETSQEMYNLTVADAHTYYVGDGQWLVHNACTYRARFEKQVGRPVLKNHELHHGYPQDFEPYFRARGIDIDAPENLFELPRGIHRLVTDDGIHTGPYNESWNGRWEAYIGGPGKNASYSEIIAFRNQLGQEFNIMGYLGGA